MENQNDFKKKWFCMVYYKKTYCEKMVLLYT